MIYTSHDFYIATGVFVMTCPLISGVMFYTSLNSRNNDLMNKILFLECLLTVV